MVSSSFFASVAQLVEQQTFNLWVPGSSPGEGTMFGSVAQQVRASGS